MFNFLQLHLNIQRFINLLLNNVKYISTQI